MTEQDILKKIMASAESVEIPEGLEPDKIEAMLETVPVEKKSQFNWKAGHLVAAAAVLVIALGVMPMGMLFDGTDKSIGNESAMLQESAGEAEGQQQATAPESVEEILVEEKQDAGELYLVAKSEEDVADFLKENYDEATRYLYKESWVMDGVILESAEGETSGAVMDKPVADLGASSINTSNQDKLSYSTTNLQMAGVDESDIIKTNGTHIFVAKEDKILIFGVKNGEVEEVGSIKPPLETFSDEVLEMYVDGDRLMLILQKASMESGFKAQKDVEYSYDIAYHFDTNYSTTLYTYDISIPSKPVEIGSMEQDGTYKTSRKIGKTVYLFTTEYIDMYEVEENDVSDLSKMLPVVDGEVVTYDNIYLPAHGTHALVAASISLDNPSDVVDSTLIFNDYVEIYVSTNAMYLYNTDYSGKSEVTNIAKFSLKAGRISAVAATNVPGEIRDTFAINESKNKLRVLTTTWEDGNSNHLYILDSELKPEGSIRDIAKGEMIYAARYFGDLVYFITYRNMDPLFVADLSDSKNPKILGELEITGYSDYLHMWGEDKLLGIGYETDPNNGSRKGIKLVMFDISKPAELSILDTVVLKEADYSSALDAYKTVLADQGENIIGFQTIDYDKKDATYHVYSFENGEFQEQLETAFGKSGWGTTCTRGIYINDYFYLINQDEISSFNRVNSYNEVKTIEIR